MTSASRRNPSPMRDILVTGANGFIGRRVCQMLIERGHRVHGGVRDQACLNQSLPGSEWVRIGNIGADTDWQAALQGIEVVVHLAARVHVMRETALDPLAVYREVNVAGTVRLASQAVHSGVKRLIYVSSLKVNGETTATHPFTAADPPAPHDAYAQSKWETEQALRALGQATGLEVLIIRPPLVYGPGVGGNFRRLLHCVDWGIPLPLGSVTNRRSLVALDNVTDLIIHCVSHPITDTPVFLVSDSETLSTPQLITRLAVHLGRRPRLLKVPVRALRRWTRLLGRQALYDRLCASLEVDITSTRQMLGWQPVQPADEALAQTAGWYRQRTADKPRALSV